MNSNRYIFANIQIPIEISSATGEYHTLLERAVVHFSECNELPPIQDHSTKDLLAELTPYIGARDQRDTAPVAYPIEIDPEEMKKTRKPLNASFKKYHSYSSKKRNHKSKMQYTHKTYVT